MWAVVCVTKFMTKRLICFWLLFLGRASTLTGVSGESRRQGR